MFFRAIDHSVFWVFKKMKQVQINTIGFNIDFSIQDYKSFSPLKKNATVNMLKEICTYLEFDLLHYFA